MSTEYKLLTIDGLRHLLQKVANLFNTCVTKQKNETITGVKTFSNGLIGNLTGNVTGNLTGNVTGNVSGSSASCTGTAARATGDADGNAIKTTYLKLGGGKMTGDLKITTDTANQIRLIQGNYGVLLRNDGSSFYMLVTNSGEAENGTWNSLRPFYFSNSTGVCNISGNAATATALQTARTINGVSFNGTANITVADSTKVPLAGGNLTGRCKITGNNFGWQVTNGTETIEFMIGSGKINRGFWDTKLNKWAVYANDSEVVLNGRATGTSSDKRIKQDFTDVPDEVLDAWGEVKWTRFRLKKEAEKNSDAPFHVGAIAQDIQESLQSGGIDPSKYGLVYHESIPEEEIGQPSEDAPEVMKEDQWYLRYEEALAIEAAYQRRRADRLEKRIISLENEIKRLANVGI